MSPIKGYARFLILAVILVFSVAMVGCPNSASNSGIGAKLDLPVQNVDKVGFDLDDTLLFSSPAFQQGFQSEVTPFSREFWEVVNSSDAEHSCIKPRTLKILNWYRKNGAEVYIITARQGYNGEHLREFLQQSYDIPTDHVYFESDGKTARLKELGVDVYFGDSDSDIKEAQAADITAIRIQRSSKSNYEKKYNPGQFDEKVVDKSAEHTCEQKK